MTTVVIDFKERKVLADRQTTQTYYEETSVLNMMTGTEPEINKESFRIKFNDKIHKVGDVVIVGSGNRDEILRLKKEYTYRNHIPKPKTDDVTLAVVRCKGDGLFVELYDGQKGKRFWNSPTWDFKTIQGNDTIITFGSGGDYAYGAIRAGVSSEEAMVVASKCDKYTSFEYDVVTLGEES